MDLKCPRCQGPAIRGSGRSNTMAQVGAGVVGALLYAAFAGYHCAQCGELKKAEFPAAIQQQMTMRSVKYVAGAVAVLVAVVVLLTLLNR